MTKSERCECCGARWNMGDNQWSPFPENIPEKHDKYFITYRDLKNGNMLPPDVAICRYYGDKKWGIHEWGLVTAFMPLPNPFNHEIEIV